MGAAEDAIATFTKQWYNALSAGIDLNPRTFQLAQGSVSLGTTSDQIWQFFDSIPPAAINQFFNPGSLVSFAQTYAAVINNLYPQNGDAEQQLLQDHEVAWQQYKADPKNRQAATVNIDKTQPDWINKAMMAMFDDFAFTEGLDKGTINAMHTIINQLDVVSQASLMLSAANSSYAYTPTIGKLTTAIQSGQSKQVTLNSQTANTDVSNSWAHGSVSGEFRWFSAAASGDWSSFTQDLSSSGFELTVSYDKVATLQGGPYANASITDPDMKKYAPWYNSSALNMAYKNNNNNVWQHESPTWEETFGDQGCLKRTTTALIVVDGIKSTMTSRASVSSDKRDSFKSAAKAGFWPFFQAEGQGGWSHEVSFNNDGSFSVTSSCKPGNRTVLGCLVSDLTSQFK